MLVAQTNDSSAQPYFLLLTTILIIEHDGGESRVTFLPDRFLEALEDDEIKQISNSRSYRVRCTGLTENSPNVQMWNGNKEEEEEGGEEAATISCVCSVPLTFSHFGGVHLPI